MRIRQAHAIITALQTLEAVRGYEFGAFEHDHPENTTAVDDDYATGHIDIVLRPGPSDRTVTAEVVRDFEHLVLRRVSEVRMPETVTVNEFNDAGSRLAEQIDTAIQADAERLARTLDPNAKPEDDPS